jgi:hypothetical protein
VQTLKPAQRPVLARVAGDTAHLGIVLEPGAHLCRLFFPVLGSRSHDNMITSGVLEGEIEVVCDKITSLLSSMSSREVCTDEVETCLCKSKPDRLLKKFDMFIKGQSLFRMDEDGNPYVKLYGSSVWNRL